jgi:tRNA modification GTPase
VTTIAAIATAAGRGGVGVIRISGPDALDILRQLSLQNAPPEPRRACLSVWKDSDGEVLDQGLALYFPSPRSYTGEDIVELQGHGGPVLLRALLNRLFELGCRPAGPGEFTRRAVENGKMDLAQAEAVAACIDAATVRAGKQAQKQMQGAFGQRISQLMERLTDLLAHVEASLDFPEEEIPPLFFERLQRKMQLEVIEPVKTLLDSAQLGERLFDGATVAIIGAPNVGKSSLLNALSGRDRAIVSNQPGTTRDVLEVDFEVHGIPVRLADTAGLRASEDHIEQEGVRRAELAASQADAVIFVADAGRPETWSGHPDADICLMNKTDLADSGWPEHFLPLCALRRQGLDQLRDVLAARLGDMQLAEEDVLVTRERHRLALSKALMQVETGMKQLGREDQLDLAAMEWRGAWTSLGEIIGIGDIEYLLDRIFSEFCIGK